MIIKGYSFRAKNQKQILSGFKKILKTGMISEGEYANKLNNTCKGIIKSKYIVTVSSGSAALNVLYRYLRIKKKIKRIGIPTNTFYATYRMAETAGLEPVLLPCKELLLDYDKAKEIIKKKNLRSICMVHNGGFIEKKFIEFNKWCKSNKIILVEDCAHALGSSIDNKHCGNFGIAGAFSFFATKTIAAGEGGIISTNNRQVYEFCENYKNYGKKEKWVSYHSFHGENLRMNEFSAVVAYHQVKKINNILNERKKIVDMYNSIIPKYLRYNGYINMDRCSFYKYPIYTDISSKLNNYNIGLSGGIYDLPLHLQPIINKNMRDDTYKHQCLPLYQGMTSKELKYLTEKIKLIFNEKK